MLTKCPGQCWPWLLDLIILQSPVSVSHLVTTLCVPSLLHTSTKRMHMVHISQLSFYRSLASIHFYSEKLSGLSEPKVVHFWERCLCCRNLCVLTIMGSGFGCQRSEAEHMGNMVRQQYFVASSQPHVTRGTSASRPASICLQLLLNQSILRKQGL